jgi:hypothetical protein
MPSRPQWSMCAWVTITASSEAKSISGGIALRASSAGEPWNMPKSTRMRAFAVRSSVQLPVTSPAAP